MSRKYLLKLLALFTRFYVIFFGCIDSLVTTFYIITSIINHDSEFIVKILPAFVWLLILIFPFRLLKSHKHLKLYFNVLLINTIFNTLVITFIYKYPFNLNPFLFFNNIYNFILEAFILFLNLYFVHLYISHRLNSKLINPLFEKKDYKLLFVPLFFLVLIFSYIFIDIRTTPWGKAFFVFPIIPDATANFDEKALNSSYSFDSYVDNHKTYHTINLKIIKNLLAITILLNFMRITKRFTE